MDANNTRFHLLMGHDDWTPLISGPDLSWDEARRSIGLAPVPYVFRKSPGDKPLEIQNRRGSGVDRYGNWYWISKDKRSIRVLPMGLKESKHFWSVEDMVFECRTENSKGSFRPDPPRVAPLPLELQGLAITEHHYLVVGVLNIPGLLIFDLHAGGPPIQIAWPADVPFCPFDMSPAPGGGVWILDLNETPRYWTLDKNFRVMPVKKKTLEKGVFKPVQGAPDSKEDCSVPAAVSLDLSIPIAAQKPVAIEGLPDGSVLILENVEDATYNQLPKILLYRKGRPREAKYEWSDTLKSFIDLKTADGSGYGLRGHDFAFVADQNESQGASGTLYIADINGNQTFVFKLKTKNQDLSLDLQINYFPMRKFGGKGLVTHEGEVFYDFKERWLPLVEQKRPMYEEEADLITDAFDGREPDCAWHRVFLDASIPSGAGIRIESRSANEESTLQYESWQIEPVPYQRGRGAEIPYYRPYSTKDENIGNVGTWELLLQNAKGRYLQLRLTLKGTKQNTPRIRALRVYYPRFSYLNEYLPVLYREDARSADFLERFLANVEGLYTTLEDRIAQAQILFDIETAPSEYLDWLAGWLGLILDSSWGDDRRRLFIAHAMELFAQRGTLLGLLRAIRIATDHYPDDSIFNENIPANAKGSNGNCLALNSNQYSVRIVEDFLTRQAPGVVFGDPTEAEGPGVTTAISDWSPEKGPEPLHKKYRDYLKHRYKEISDMNDSWGKEFSSFDDLVMPPVTPISSAEADDWKGFLKKELGFVYFPVEETAADTKAYRDFLARRYRRVRVLNKSYQTEYQAFNRIPLPQDMPENRFELHDWIQFVSTILPTIKNAHRFTVLVPSFLRGDSKNKGPDPALVHRVVEQEKPAHTEFEVKEYVAMFRVGEARLGFDTFLDAGSRLTAIILGQSYLAQGHLALAHPWDVEKRIVVGRDRIDPNLKL